MRKVISCWPRARLQKSDSLVLTPTVMSVLNVHSPRCCLLAPHRKPLHQFVPKSQGPRVSRCTCCAQQRRHLPAMPAQLLAFLSAPAAIAEEVQQQAQQAVEQGQQAVGQAQDVVEQVQQQFKLPSDLQYPTGSGMKLPAEFDGVSDFAGQYPAVIAAGVAVIAIGALIARLVGQGVTVKQLSAAKAFDLLSEQPDVVFIDLRSKDEVKETGSPDLRSIKQKIVSLPYTVGPNRDVVEGFTEKLLSLSVISEETDIILFDAYGQDAKAIAKAVREGVKQVYWVADGAEGVKGWKASQLPWKEPSRGFNFNFPDFSGVNLDKLAEDFKSKPTLTKGALAVGAVGAAAVVLFNEVEIVLEVLGVAAAGNFLAKKLLFAKDREQTVDQIRDIVDNKIAAGDVRKDLKRVADTLVETATTTERTVEKNVSPQIKDAAKSAKDGVKKVSSKVDSQTKDVQSKAKSAGKDLEKKADKTADKAQSQTKDLQSKGKDVAKGVKSEAKSAGKDLEKTADRTADKAQSQTKDLQSKGKDVAKDVKSEAKSVGKTAEKTADKAADKTQSQTKDLQSKGKDVAKDVKSEAKSVGKDAEKAADKTGSQAQKGAQQAQSGASKAGDDSKRKFEQQKAEVVGESKENIKEAKQTLGSKGKSSSNGAGKGPDVPSQQDVKAQAKEARNWIQDWRKKQPVKADA